MENVDEYAGAAAVASTKESEMESRKRRKLANSSNTPSPDKNPSKNTAHRQRHVHPVAEDWSHTNTTAAIPTPDTATLGRGGDDSDGEARNCDEKAEQRDRKKVKEEGELWNKSGERLKVSEEGYIKKGEDRVKVSKEGDSKRKGSQEGELRKSGDRFKEGESKKSGERKLSKEGELKKSRDRVNVGQEGESNSRRKPSSRERRSEKGGRVDGKGGGSVEREEVRDSEGRDGSETNGRGVGFSEGGVGSRHGGGGNGKKRVDGSKVGKVGDEGRMARGEIKQEDEREARTIANAAVHGSGGMSRARGEREKHSGRGFANERGEWEYSEYGKGLDMKESGTGESREGWIGRGELDERFDVVEDGRDDANWTPFDDYLAATSGRGVERGEERLSRRVSREDRAESSGERIETADVVSDQPRGRKKGGHKASSSWDGSEEVKGRGRAKRGRDDDRRARSRGKDRGDGGHDDSDSGARGSGRRRGDESRSHRSQTRNGGVSEWGEPEGVTRSSGKTRNERSAGDGDRIERSNSGRARRDLGREDADDSVRSSGRGRAENGLDEWADKPGISGGLTLSEPSGEALKMSSKAKGEKEVDRLEKQRDNVGKERANGIMDGIDNVGRLGGRSRGQDNRHEKMKSRDTADGSRDESDGGKSGSRLRRVGKSVRDTWSSDGRKAFRGDFDEWGWVDDDESDQERASGRNDRDFERVRYNDGSWDNARHRQWEEDGDRHRIRHRDGPDFDRKRDRAERDRSDRERQERGFYGGVGPEGSAGHKGMVLLNDMMGRGPPGVPPLGSMMDSGRGILSAGPFFPRVGGDSGVQGEFVPGMSDLDSEGLNHDERGRGPDVGYNDMRERHMDDEPPPGLDPAMGPSPGRGGGNDGIGGFNIFGGRGRAKGSNNRSRGAMQMHDNRPPFVNNQGAGMMIRGMPGSKGGRGGRGPGKVGRGGGRDGQRGAMTVISQMGPGMPGPLFGQLGPPGPIGGLGPGIMGPGGFPLPPFGGRMGWNGGGDMSMMNGPPGPVPGPSRFVPGMGPGLPGLVPNVFFSSPGPVRGGPGGMVLGGMFGGGSPFGGRQGPIIGDRGPSGGRSIARGGGAAGRGPSRGEQNDYSQHFVDTGLRPQNFIRDVDLADRFEEYPKLKELIARKDKLIADRATPPMYMQCDLRTTELRPEVFGTKFDVILVDPPWEEYVRRAPGVGDSMEWWSHADIQSLRIEAISDTPAFIFLWVGDAEGLDQGRVCLKKWGFRRCEDICWVKTNRENPTPALRHDSNTVLQHSKEHCLMGIKGTVRRSTDGHIIHANVDTDIIISEEPDYGSTAKPEELYHIIEHFAQGQRRIELFGEDHNIRAGWVTVGKGLSSSNFSPQTYSKHFLDSEGKVWQGGRGNPPVDAPHLVGTTSEIESLRPKSPPPRAAPQPPPPAANSSQPSGTIASNKRTSSLPQGGLPVVSGAGHTAVLPVETGPIANAGKGGNNGQTPKLAEPTGLPDSKLPGVNLAAAKVANDEKGLGTEVTDAPVELEVNGKADQ